MKSTSRLLSLGILLMVGNSLVQAQCPPLPTPTQSAPVCPVDLVQIRGAAPNGDGLLFTQVWRDGQAVDVNGTTQVPIASVFTATDVYGLPAHPTTSSTSFPWPTVGITYTGSGSEPTSSSIQYSWPTCNGSCNGNGATNDGIEQAQQDGWLILPDSISCIQFRVKGINGKAAALYLSNDGFLSSMVNVLECFGNAGQSGTATTWTIPAGLPITDFGQGFRYTRLRLYHHDELNLADTRVQWDIGDGLVDIPRQYFQSVPFADAQVNLPSGMKTQGGIFAYRDAQDSLFSMTSSQTLGPRLILDTRFKQSDSLLVTDVISGSACDDTFSCGPLRLVAVRRTRPGNLNGQTYFRQWTGSNAVTSNVTGQQDYLEAFNSGASLPNHPSSPTIDWVQNPSNAFGMNLNSNPFGFQAAFDAWLLVPPNVPCIQFRLGDNPSTTQSTALFLGNNYFNLSRVAMEVDGEQEGGTYCLDGNHSSSGNLGWRWVRARLYIHDDGGVHDSRVKWNLGQGFVHIPSDYMYSCSDPQENTIPSLGATISGAHSTQYGLQDTLGNVWAENGNQPPTTLIRSKERLDLAVVVDPIQGCNGQVPPTTGSDCQTTRAADPCNLPPIALPDADTTVQNVMIYLFPLINDTDPDSTDRNIIRIVNIIIGPSLGDDSIMGRDTIRYKPGDGNFGDDQFDYVVCDDGTPPLCDTARFFIRISKDIDKDRVPDERDRDNDNDGISDQIERLAARNGGDSDDDGKQDSLDLDADNDGLPDIVESGWVQLDSNGRAPLDSIGILLADTNGNGWDDIAENRILRDADLDSILDFQDLDSDNDGHYDIQEAGMGSLSTDGVFTSLQDTGGTGWDYRALSATRDTDRDQDSVPAWLDLDADNDGIPNILEERYSDLDSNGRLDNLIDADSNGAHDALMVASPLNNDPDNIPNYHDLDSDNDGIADMVENGQPDPDSIGSFGAVQMDNNDDGWRDGLGRISAVDHDQDGWGDFIDLDAENDGLYDRDEEFGRISSTAGRVKTFNDALQTGWDDDERLHGIRDLDGDLIPDRIDLDTDNDGIPDIVESGGQDLLPKDGRVDAMQDANGDGADDTRMRVTFIFHDGDTIFDHHDLDADNDGRSDHEEGGGNGPGPMVNMAPGSDPDGWANSFPDPGLRDSDSDSLPDRLDLDSDNDGITDLFESMPSYVSDSLDLNRDGRLDTLQDLASIGWYRPITESPAFDTDRDGYPDYIDLDADQDGLADLFEDRPGRSNFVGAISPMVDSNGDGAHDPFVNSPREDWDNDSVPNFRDLDSDQDGIADAVEAGHRDDKGGPAGRPDGQVDNVSDSNGDGWLDIPLAGRIDPDGDSLIAQLDRDSDNDGIPDVIEGSGNYPIANGHLEALVDGPTADGWDDLRAIFQPLDTDRDGTADYLDWDSDGDGILDVIEGNRYHAKDTLDTLDANLDGMLDAFRDLDGYGWDSTSCPRSPKDSDDDRDPFNPALAFPDYRDPDSDGDGLSDQDESLFEFGEHDCNNDNIPDWLDPAPCNAEFYDAFSPNGDGLNDEFVVEGIDYHLGDNRFTVFNRWGVIVFRDSNWGGTWNGICNFGLYADGAPAPDGLYYYVFEFDQKTQFQKGYFYLRR